MKLSVSAYRAHASAHKKILDTAYQLNYGSTSASHHVAAGSSTGAAVSCTAFQVRYPRNLLSDGDEMYGLKSDDETKI